MLPFICDRCHAVHDHRAPLGARWLVISLGFTGDRLSYFIASKLASSNALVKTELWTPMLRS